VPWRLRRCQTSQRACVVSIVLITARPNILARVSAELHQAFVVLLEGETGPVARAAMETIRTSALAMARADGRRRGDHDDCAQEVAFKLWKRLSMGDCPVRNLCAASCSAYVHRMVENWLTDRHRRDVTRRARR